MVVLKFGGSSVGCVERCQRAVSITKEYADAGVPVAVIVSALSGVTDQLVAACNDEKGTQGNVSSATQWLHERHTDHAKRMLNKTSQEAFAPLLDRYLAEAKEILQLRAQATEPGSPGIDAERDVMLAMGERLSMHLFALALSDAGVNNLPVDATRLIFTDDAYGNARVCREETRDSLHSWRQEWDDSIVAVITGFIGCASNGKTTTLGRGGSDYSASLIAAGLSAQKLERWTDVNGVYTSDPRKDAGARRLESLVMEDALRWSRAGTMGLHRKTLDPLIGAGVPMYVRSIDDPRDPGTAIYPRRYKITL